MSSLEHVTSSRCPFFTHRVQHVPGIVAWCKHGEGSFSLCLLLQLGEVGILLRGGRLDESQRPEDVVNGCHWRRRTVTNDDV